MKRCIPLILTEFEFEFGAVIVQTGFLEKKEDPLFYSTDLELS